MSQLRIDHVVRCFGGVRAVDDISFTLTAGEVAALIGPNGAGKTTLFNVIDGQLAPDAGSVMFEGRSLAGVSTARRARLGIGRTFQVAQAFATMTVQQNLQLAVTTARRRHMRIGQPLWRVERDESAALLQQVGLTALAAQPAAVLAYGDLKRLELALALAATPRLLLMDEPTAGMAPGERTALMRLVVRLASERGMSVLFTEHSMDVVFGFAQRVLVIARGRLLADGQPEAVRADPEVRQVYLGEEA